MGKRRNKARKEARRNNVEDQIERYGSLSELEFGEKRRFRSRPDQISSCLT
jgi:hypothetical protein